MRSVEKWGEDEKLNIRVEAMDVTSDDSVSSLVEKVIKEDGTIDIVVNNAGFGLAGALEVVKIEEAKSLFEVNVWGVVRVLQAVLPHMRRRRTGHVINISSTTGIRGIPCLEFYTGSKFALEGIMDSMRYSMAAYNISVTNVNPGPVRTSFASRYGDPDQGGRGTREVVQGEYLQTLTDRMVAGLSARINSPEGQSSDDLAKLVVNVATMKLRPRARLTDIPFNIGSTYDSQHLLEQIRVQPTGWGDGVYNQILQSVPPLSSVSVKKDSSRDEL
eukprot:gene27337-34040_t